MATIQETFGASANVDTSDANNPILEIHFADMPGWDTAADASDPDKWLAAIMTSAIALTQANPNEIRGVVVQPWSPGFVQTVVIDQTQVTAQTYSAQVTAYVPSTLGTSPDPDDVL